MGIADENLALDVGFVETREEPEFKTLDQVTDLSNQGHLGFLFPTTLKDSDMGWDAAGVIKQLKGRLAVTFPAAPLPSFLDAFLLWLDVSEMDQEAFKEQQQESLSPRLIGGGQPQSIKNESARLQSGGNRSRMISDIETRVSSTPEGDIPHMPLANEMRRRLRKRTDSLSL